MEQYTCPNTLVASECTSGTVTKKVYLEVPARTKGFHRSSAPVIKYKILPVVPHSMHLILEELSSATRKRYTAAIIRPVS